MPNTPFIYADGSLLETSIGIQGVFHHSFGHSREIQVINGLGKPVVAHLILDLDLADPRLSLVIPGLSRLPLLHPFRHDGGMMKYRLISDDLIEILEIRGELSEDWPYADYPERFAVVPFDLGDPQPCAREHFDEQLYQGVPNNHWSQFIVVIPEANCYGQGLWQPDSDVPVNAMFYFDPVSRVVVTNNECD